MFEELRALPALKRAAILDYLIPVEPKKPSGNSDYQQGLYDGFRMALSLVEKNMRFMLFD